MMSLRAQHATKKSQNTRQRNKVNAQKAPWLKANIYKSRP